MLDFAERVVDSFQLMHCCDCGYQCAGLERCLYDEMYETMFVVARNFHDSLFYFYSAFKTPSPPQRFTPARNSSSVARERHRVVCSRIIMYLPVQQTWSLCVGAMEDVVREWLKTLVEGKTLY